VNEASSYLSLGRYLYTDTATDYDLDGDGSFDIDSKAVFRGGGGDLSKHAQVTGKSFAGAKPPKQARMSETVELLFELIEE
jgi:hypothetical protein